MGHLSNFFQSHLLKKSLRKKSFTSFQLEWICFFYLVAKTIIIHLLRRAFLGVRRNILEDTRNVPEVGWVAQRLFFCTSIIIESKSIPSWKGPMRITGSNSNSVDCVCFWQCFWAETVSIKIKKKQTDMCISLFTWVEHRIPIWIRAG